ncbi:hypothetical protein B0H66DRAFT_607378 [Apodospora peruviana]|uniref:Uncharacterized protein n=1 Tax=Apodospora peruviana TaxID=516989 RepID=A0AAE0HWH3_9PEZI|nr:hypothetical protein B0H66DRAFT_607378 [Apodospora peruviana]
MATQGPYIFSACGLYRVLTNPKKRLFIQLDTELTVNPKTFKSSDTRLKKLRLTNYRLQTPDKEGFTVLQHGDIIELYTDDLKLRPLLSYAIMEVTYALTRVLGALKAAGFLKDVLRQTAGRVLVFLYINKHPLGKHEMSKSIKFAIDEMSGNEKGDATTSLGQVSGIPRHFLPPQNKEAYESHNRIAEFRRAYNSDVAALKEPKFAHFKGKATQGS